MLHEHMDRKNTTHLFLLILVIFAIGLFLKLAQSVLIPLLIALLLTYIMDPLMILLRKYLPVWLSTVITSIVFLAVLGGFSILFLINLAIIGRDFPLYQEALLEQIQNLSIVLQGFVDNLLKQDFTIDLWGDLSTVSIPSVVFSTARSTISIFGSFLLVYLFAILFLAAKYYLPTRLSRVFGQNKETNPIIISVILHNIDTSLRRFIAVKTLISLLIGTLTAITAFFFGVSYPLFWGLITFFLNYIPTVGSFFATIGLTLFTLAQFGDWPIALTILLTALFLQNITGSLLEPLITRDTFNLSLLVVFVSLFFWGWLWGPAGILLAVPMTTSLKVILENIPSTAKIAVLLERSR